MGEQLRLEQEVIRLTQELDQAVAEKEQAAQYGLVLLEEKDALEARCQVSATTCYTFIKSQGFSLKETSRYNKIW